MGINHAAAAARVPLPGSNTAIAAATLAMPADTAPAGLVWLDTGSHDPAQ